MRPRWLPVACVAIAALTTSACSPSVSRPATRTPPYSGADKSVSISLAGWATVRIPRRWHVTTFRGEPATVYFPLEFLSSESLTPMCPGRITQSCAAQNWFAPDWVTPDGGVIVLWSHAEFPTGPALANVTGRSTVVDGHPAKVGSGTETTSCPPGAASDVLAYVSASAVSGERFDMTACFGPHASSDDRAAVLLTLDSLRTKYPT